MAFEIVMPQLGLTMEEGAVSKWLVKEGDVVHKGDPLFEVTTDKLTNEVTSEFEGTVLKLIAPENEDVPVQAVLGYIGTPGEAVGEAEVVASPEPAKDPTEQPQGGGATSVMVIGGGPGGYVASIRAAQLGAQVTLIEKDELGGTCLNRGCIPTKSLLHATEIYQSVKDGGSIGIEAENLHVNWEKVQQYTSGVVQQLTGGVANLVRLNKIQLVKGVATFTGAKTVEVNGTSYTADKIIIAAGSKPRIPPIPGVDCDACIDSTQCLTLPEIPKSMVIIGGGVIGVELGSIYARLGTKITILEMMPRLLPMMDGELTGVLTDQLRKEMEIHLETKVLSVEATKNGAVVHTQTPEGDKDFEGEKVLVCIGRGPDTEELCLENAGVETNRGFVTVNDKMETSVPGIYAIGDCNGLLMLAHAASAMGEIAVENALGANKKFSKAACPSVVYIGPEFAGVGFTEEQLKEEGIAYKVGKFTTSGNGRSLILGETKGIVKVLTGDAYGEILGVHILAPSASEMIQQAVMAITLEATSEELIDMIYAHPSVSESLREATLASEKRAIHAINR